MRAMHASRRLGVCDGLALVPQAAHLAPPASGACWQLQAMHARFCVKRMCTHACPLRWCGNRTRYRYRAPPHPALHRACGGLQVILRSAVALAIVNETLRLRPAVGAIFRVAVRDTALTGVIVPRGTRVALATAAVRRQSHFCPCSHRRPCSRLRASRHRRACRLARRAKTAAASLTPRSGYRRRGARRAASARATFHSARARAAALGSTSRPWSSW
jgi:hypothetical protein